ncbi:MAG: septum formation initiator family protein [Clostridiales Family XIII bacterium]|jgi:cell division protein FtsB|nr:septum formation initiator family protein [Clostridiales Family XIII bacterium]
MAERPGRGAKDGRGVVSIDEARLERERKSPPAPRRRRRRAFAFRWVYLLCFAIVLAAAGYYAAQIVSLQDELEAAQADRKAAQDERARLENEYAGLDTPAYWEQKSRDMLHMVRPGELIFVPPDGGAGEAGADAGEPGEDSG